MRKKYSTEEIIKKFKEKHENKYDYSLVEYITMKTKTKIVCNIHGIFEQRVDAHLCGSSCPKCSRNIQPSTDEFIERSIKIHGNKYDYSLSIYKDSKTKVKIICSIHGIFEQFPPSHLNGCGCLKCSGRYNYSTEEWIVEARKIHGNKYDYSLVEYKKNSTKVKIICPIHGIFEQTPNKHLSGCGCKECGKNKSINNRMKYKNNKPLFKYYNKKISWCEETRETKDGFLEVRCKKCDKWFIPNQSQLLNRLNVLNGNYSGEKNFYCSDECKTTCSIFNKQLYPTGMNPNIDRPYQYEWSKEVLKQANYKCEICGSKESLVAHHIKPVKTHPLLQADIDNGMCLCYNCHNKVHIDECSTGNLKGLVC